MIETTTYSPSDLKIGICPSCGEESNEIYVDDPDGRCLDCIHDQDFYEMTMEGLQSIYKCTPQICGVRK